MPLTNISKTCICRIFKLTADTFGYTGMCPVWLQLSKRTGTLFKSETTTLTTPPLMAVTKLTVNITPIRARVTVTNTGRAIKPTITF
jgi:hypothetical protein